MTNGVKSLCAKEVKNKEVNRLNNQLGTHTLQMLDKT